MGEATMTFGRKCKIAGKVGFGILIAGIFLMIISFLLWLFFSTNTVTLILGIICSLLMGIGLLLIPLFFVGQHFLCLGRIEMNTRIMLENQEKLNKKIITRISLNEKKQISNID